MVSNKAGWIIILKVNNFTGCNDLSKASELYDSKKVYEDKELKSNIDKFIAINCGQ